MKILYIGSGKSATIVNTLNKDEYYIICTNNAWKLFENSHFNVWIYSGDFPEENKPKTKIYDINISSNQYKEASQEIINKLNISCSSPGHYLGYTIFFNGLYWIMNQYPNCEIYLLGFDHDYNYDKVKKWNDNNRPNPQNNYLKPKDQSILDWSNSFFDGMASDAFYGHGTPDPMRLGMEHLKEKMKQALKHADILDIKIYNLSPIDSEFNKIIPKFYKKSNIIQNEVNRIKKETTIYKTRAGVMVDTLKFLEEGDIFEFGVFTGNSLRFISKHMPNKKIYAFDSFEGLPEAWPGARSLTHKKGHFNVHGNLPKINNKNISYVKGFFEDTLPSFMQNYNNKISLIHIDCDIYSSTKTILHYMKPYIKQNTVIVFDEFIGYPDFEINEIKAWMEFVSETNVKYQYLYSATEQVSLKVL